MAQLRISAFSSFAALVLVACASPRATGLAPSTVDVPSPVLSSPTAAPAAPAADASADRPNAAPPLGPARRAEACLADAACAAAEADRLFIVADDARDPELDCDRFLDGAGTQRDLARARGCLARGRNGACASGSSPFLDTAELAAMMIGGHGGATDIRGARDLLRDCYDDVTRGALMTFADERERDPSRNRSADYCEYGSGTTLIVNGCQARARTVATTRASLARKAMVAGLDAEGRRLLSDATSANAAYAEAMSEYVYEVNVSGTIRRAMATACEEEIAAERARDLAGFSRFTARNATLADAERASKRAAQSIAARKAATPREAELLVKATEAWRVYREAEVALFVNAFGPAQGEARVRASASIRLDARRPNDCRSTWE